jgi:uncharacterized protein (TIGR02266 family)
MSDFERQRRFSRRSIKATLRVRDAADPSQGEIVFDSFDVSAGGAFLESELLLEVGTEIEVVFALPDRLRPVRARARVAWATRHDRAKGVSGMGVEFTDLSDDDRQSLAEFVSGG